MKVEVKEVEQLKELKFPCLVKNKHHRKIAIASIYNDFKYNIFYIEDTTEYIINQETLDIDFEILPKGTQILLTQE